MAFALLMSLLAARDARLEKALDHYDSARFAQARDVLVDLLEVPGLSVADRTEVRTYLAACYLALGDKGSAKLQLRELARERPDSRPSPAAFTPDFIALANDVFSDAEKRRAQESPPPNSPSAPPVLKTDQEAQPDLRISTPPRALAFLPLGIGHFATGRIATGVLFLLVEVAMFVTAIGTVAKLESLKAPGGDNVPFIKGDYVAENKDQARTMNYVSSATFFTGLAAVVVDVLVGNVNWPEGE
jgi:hypothetical protein